MTVDDHQFRVQLIANEVDICKQLSSNDLKKRKKGLVSLKKLLGSDQITEVDADDFNRIWNGLFNYVWMSDTPLVQEADVENISNLIHHIRSFDAVMLFVRGFFSSIANQWNRISHHRTDKFLMFIRRFLRQVLFLLRNSSWNAKKLEAFSSELYSAIQILPVGLIQHLNDIYNEELAKVSEGIIPTDALILLLKCYVDCIVNMKPSKTVINHINTNIFCALVRQVKLLIKQKAAVELDPEAFALEDAAAETDDANISENNSNLDPRPGNAHVFLPYIEFEEDKITEYLGNLISSTEMNLKSRNILLQIKQMFESVTRLRQTMKQPEKLFHEVNEKEKKRKKKHGKFSSIVKKACRRLEEEDDDQTTKKIKKLLRNNVWEVTEDVVTNPKAQSAQCWTVTDLPKKESVSFSEKIDSVSYEAESDQRDEPSSVSITVPKSSCDGRRSILTPNENYKIVDFKNFDNDETSIGNDEEVSPRNEEDAPCEPPWKEIKFNSVSDDDDKLESSFTGTPFVISLPKFEPTDGIIVQSVAPRTETPKKRSRRTTSSSELVASADVDTSLPLKKRFRKSENMVMLETETKTYMKTRGGKKAELEDDISETASVNSDFESTRGMSSDAESVGSEISLRTRSRRNQKLPIQEQRRTRMSVRRMQSDTESVTSDVSPPRTQSQSLKTIKESPRLTIAKRSGRKSAKEAPSDADSVTSGLSPTKVRNRKSLRTIEENVELTEAKSYSDIESVISDSSPVKTRGRKSLKSIEESCEKVSRQNICNRDSENESVTSDISPLKTRRRRSSRSSQEVSKVVEDRKTNRRSTRGICSDTESVVSDLSPSKTRSRKSFKLSKESTECVEKRSTRKSTRNVNSDAESVASDVSPLRTRGKKSFQSMKKISEVAEEKIGTRKSVRGNFSDTESITSDISPLKTRSRKSLRSTNKSVE